MQNTTTSILVNFGGTLLHKAVARALLHASRTLLKSYDAEQLDLASVTTKTNMGFAFCKLVELKLLRGKFIFDAAYLENAFKCSQHYKTIPEDMFYSFFLGAGSPGFNYGQVYAQRAKRGIGLFLVSLHCEGAVTLPATFKWPTSWTSLESGNAGRTICQSSELLSFVRSVETVKGRVQDQQLMVLRDPRRAEWFLSYGTRLLLATGWNKPEQSNYFDLFEIFKAQDESRGEISNVSVFKEFCTILRAKFNDRVPPGFGDPGAWDQVLTSHRSQQLFEKRSADVLNVHVPDAADGTAIPTSPLSANDAFSKLITLFPSVGSPSKLREFIASLDEENVLTRCLRDWLVLERIYMSRTKRENYKGLESALGYLNLYLYVYLIAWFRENSDTSIKFPSNPDLLFGSIFISRLVDSKTPLPKTFMEYMEGVASESNWGGNSYYSVLKQVELFFDFLVNNSHRLENCSKFVQPLTVDDFPPTTSRSRTNKVPVPRRHLGVFVAYIGAIKDYIDAVTQNVVNGSISTERVQRFRSSYRGVSVIDCKANVDLAPVPTVVINGRLISLDYIPSVFRFDWKKHIDGRILLLPLPHAVNQILVALYTGLRHNHIQWLDAEKFDSFAADDVVPQLYVNTDKTSKKPWLPRVNSEVIRILRDQLAWRKMVAEPLYMQKQFYNNNSSTAYPKFLPLFALDASGLPHSDSAYSSIWTQFIEGFQGFLLNIIEPGKEKMPILVKLRPQGVDFNDFNERQKLDFHLDSSENYIPLRVVTEITPHSARAGVVSDLIHHLPADIIGTRVTGQTERVVYYYVYLDPDETADHAAYQGQDMRNRALKRELDARVKGTDAVSSTAVKADAINSRLARSMQTNIQQAIARYGCISLVNSDGASGIDYLQERGIGQASFNSTEICPYGNNCPPELIKQLRGFRRCSICPYAVRSIDHIPAVCAAKKCTAEQLVTLDRRMEEGERNGTFGPDAMDILEDDRLRLGEEIAGWELCEEVLEQARKRIELGEDNRRWVVEKPEILLQHFQRIELKGSEPEYLMARLLESNSYPGFQSPLIAHKFDLLRRRILAKASTSLHEVLMLDIPADPAAECLGVIRSLVEAHHLTTDDLISMLSSDVHLLTIPRRTSLRIAHEAK